MTTRIGVGLNDHSDGITCGQEAARAALDQVGAAPVALALLFTSHPEPETVLRGANEALGGAPLIGTTSGGQYSNQGYVETGAGVLLVCSEEMLFYPVAHQKRRFGGRKLLGNLQGISKDGLGSAFKHRTLMLFPDDQSMNLDGVVERAMTETALFYDILGGAGLTVRTPPREPAVFHNDRMIRAGLTGTEVLSRQPLGLSLAGGWTPVSGPYRVTKASANRVSTIDGRPAWEVYEDFLLAEGVQYDPANMQDTLFTHPIGICPNGDCKVSVLMGVDDSGALLTTSPPKAGSLIHILATQPDAMITAASRAIRNARGMLDGPHAGALFIDCVSTAMVLKDAYAQQRAAVQETLGDVPYLGVRIHGVLARLSGQTIGHYECSVATCVLPGS